MITNSLLLLFSLSSVFLLLSCKCLRGAVVEWLERLRYGAESLRKVVSLSLGFAMRRLENSLCQLSSKWVPFLN